MKILFCVFMSLVGASLISYFLKTYLDKISVEKDES
jgi:hypothetical protein